MAIKTSFAVALLENLGLTVVFKGTGKVLNQSLKAGQKFDKTKIIELTLS